MFVKCSSLTALDLKSFKTENVTNMGSMFYGCSALTSLNLSSFNTSNVTTMSVMFGDCSTLTTLDISSFNTSEVTYMGSMFVKCSSLTALNLSSFNTSNVTDMRAMFYGCSALKSLDLKNFNTSNVTNMSEMFVKCSSLTALDLKNFNTSNVTNMRDMFDGCKALTSLDLSNFNTSNVTKLEAMFAHCSALTSLDLKNFNTSNVTNMGAMFGDCSTLTTLDISSFNTSNVEVMSDMFWGCKSLTSLDLSNFNTSNVEGMSKMFWSCSALKSLDLSSFNTEKVKDTRWMFADCSKLANIFSNKTWKCERSQEMFKGCTTLKGAVKYDASKLDVTMANPEMGYFTKKVEDKPEVTTPEAYVHMSADKTTLTFFYDTKRASREGTTWGIEEKKENHGFQYPAWVSTDENGDTTTTKAVFDPSFKDFRPTSTAHWFEEFNVLTAIEGLQNLNTSNVTSMNSMFYSCSALTSLDLKNFNTEKVEDMRAMFLGCGALTSLDLSNFNTLNLKDIDNMFGYCSALKSIDLRGFKTEKVEDMQHMFNNCSALTSLDLSNFNTENVTNMSGMFADCSALTSLNLKNFNTDKVEYMVIMFQNCSNLASIVCNKTWKCERSQDMFKGCTALKGAVAYDESKTDVTMANPETGYFTKKAQDKPEVTIPEAYVQMSADQKTLTFFYDTKRHTREGTTWGIEETQAESVGQYSRIYPAWSGTYKKPNTTTTKAVVDASFANFRPTKTARWLLLLGSLTDIEGLQYLNTSNVTDMSEMFAGCSRLTSLDLKSFNTEKVTNMAGMFWLCRGLTTLNLKSFNTEKVTEMGFMFYVCRSLTTLALSNFNTSNVTEMNGMFYGCSALKSLDLSSFNTSNVKDMGGMYSGCSALTSLDLKNFNTSNVTNMVAMFYDCSKLAIIVSNKAWNCEESQEMFKGCTVLKGAVAYDESKTDVTMANPETGYFTKKAQDKPEVTTPEAYVQMSADKTTLTFFYDTKRATREGTTWGINEKQQVDERVEPAWTGTYENPDTTTTKAVVDASFANFHPTSTASWFKRFKALTAIEGLQYLNTSEVTNMSDMFYYCSALTSLDLKNFNTSNVTEMNWMFTNCAALTSLDLTSFNTEKVTDMGWMFAGCKALTSLYLKNFNTQKVWNMSEMFSHCSALTSLDLSSFNTSNVENIVSMFAGCESLTTLDLSNFNTSNVTDMRTMFWACSGLTTLYLANFNTSNVKNMGYMFAHCSKLANIFSNKTWNCEKSQEMFKGCTALKGAVAYDESKTDVTMANPETGYFTKKAQDKPEVTTPEAYVQMSADKTTLTFFYDTKRATREGTTWGFDKVINSNGELVPAWVVSDAILRKMTKVVFDASFRDFRPTNTSRWFYNCYALKQIEGLEHLNTENVTDMLEMFRNCNALTSLDVSHFNTGNVRRMNFMFAGCWNLRSLDLRNFNTKKVTGMRSMFSGCWSLTSLNLTKFNTDSVTTMRGMFDGCAGLTSLDLSKFNTQNVTSMREMFDGCSGLTSLDLNNFNTQNVSNMNDMFSGCSGLTSINLKSFKTEKVTDMTKMFAGCLQLTALDLQHFKTDSIHELVGMFKDCSGLTSLDLRNFSTKNAPDMEKMFFNCSNLTKIYSETAWTSSNSYEMFGGCLKLQGTVAYDASKTNVTMANPETGYFTKKVQDKPEVTTPEAYVQMSADKTTLTFFYDTKRATREGTTWGIEEKKEDNGQQYPAWAGTYQNSYYTITKAVFDDSFANFRPTSTAQWLQSLRFLINIEGLQNLNTSEVTDMHGMFAGCKALTSLDLKSFNTSSVTNMSDMFAGCKALTALDLSYFNTSNVTEMNWMFTGCFALTTLDLKSFNTEKVTTMSGIFHACLSLTSINIPNFNTSNVANMSRMFSDCPALTSLDLKNFNTSNVTDMSGMFAGSSALTSLDLKGFNTEKVKYMVDMFYGCSKLASIISNKAWNCEQSQDMFKGCTAIKGAVAYDESKTDVTMANPETGYFTKKAQDKPEVTTPEAYVQMSADKSTLTFFYDTKRATREGTTWDITSPIATRSASLLNAPAWGGSEEKPNSTTTKVVFDASFAKFYPKTTAEWFAHYAALKRIEGIENLNTSEVTSMKGMFTGCAALDTLDLTTFNTEKVNDMSEMFKNCANLSTVVCDKVWSTPHSEQMFYGCVKLLGKAAFDANKTSVEMANPNSGYFVAVKPTALLPVFSPAGANGIYTLQGKRVRGNLQHLPAGVYIVNGKKVMVQ